MSDALLDLQDEFDRLRKLIDVAAQLELRIEERAEEIAEQLARLTKTGGQADALD